MTVTPVPVGEAQGRCKRWSFRGVDQAEQLEMGAGVNCRGPIGKVRKAGRGAVQAEKQGRIARHCLPIQPAERADRRSTIVPRKLPSLRVVGELSDGLGV
jgi:hypothetical protein